MDCSWWGPGNWSGWFWLNQLFFWLLLLAAVGFLLYRAIRKGHRQHAGNSIAGYSQRSAVQRECPNCAAPIEQAYLCCPECHYRLKMNCPFCGKLVKTNWDICPFCEGKLSKVNEASVTN